VNEQPAGHETAADETETATRWARVRHALLLVWGAVLVAAVLTGIVGFLVHFLLLQL
jgi:hypothetical protein